MSINIEKRRLYLVKIGEKVIIILRMRNTYNTPYGAQVDFVRTNINGQNMEELIAVTQFVASYGGATIELRSRGTEEEHTKLILDIGAVADGTYALRNDRTEHSKSRFNRRNI